MFLGLEERAGFFWCGRKLFGDFIKIKMKTGCMAYVMEHRLYGLFFCVVRSEMRRGERLWEQKDGLE